jgi:hypothetical protein
MKVTFGVRPGVRPGRNTGRLIYLYDPEHICRDPKDGELCLSKMKPGETLVEV